MPRWLLVTLCLVAFAAAMLAVRAVLVAVLGVALPGVDTWLDDTIGRHTHAVIVVAILLACGVLGFWPRDAAGRMRPLPRRR